MLTSSSVKSRVRVGETAQFSSKDRAVRRSALSSARRLNGDFTVMVVTSRCSRGDDFKLCELALASSTSGVNIISGAWLDGRLDRRRSDSWLMLAAAMAGIPRLMYSLPSDRACDVTRCSVFWMPQSGLRTCADNNNNNSANNVITCAGPGVP